MDNTETEDDGIEEEDEPDDTNLDVPMESDGDNPTHGDSPVSKRRRTVSVLSLIHI